MFKPVFILGCGRSGTTILGEVLSRHSKILYLYEPRGLWVSAYPQTDIWSDQAAARGGKLLFGKEDAVEGRTRLLTGYFLKLLSDYRRSLLVEKLPINNFRAFFIREMFPAARYVYIWRNGCEVASSIEKLCQQGQWFAASTYKWDLLVEHARSNKDTAHLPALCDSFYLKGLLEWRLSVTAAAEFLATLPSDQYVSLSYPELTNDPVASIERVLNFLGVGQEQGVSDFAGKEIRARQEVFGRELTAVEKEVGGPPLEASLTSTLEW